ncbi:TonB-dependent receptor [Puteibacter caeruleilacunae]|nr:TonB-dependent receptor [Puteibacter caeruleilacunae]
MYYVDKLLPRLICALILLCSVVLNANAQSKIIRGTVKDEAGTPIIGATVIEVDANNRMINGTATNIDGVYTIKCSTNTPTLKFSFIGFKDQTIKLKAGELVVNPTLEEETSQIDEVSVVAVKREKVNMGYLELDKRDATGAVSIVNLEEVAPSHVSDVGEMLQGQAAGLLVTSNSGDPGAGVTIKIRGSASLNANSNPLIVVDGVPVETDKSFDSLEDFTDYSRSPLSDINPDDIEGITILKDASSTAIYGSRGANGVILITTKRGKKGKTMVNYSFKMSTQPGKDYLPLLSGPDLKTLWLEMDQNSYSAGSLGSNNLTRPELRDDPTRADYEYFNNDTKWTDFITKDGITQDHTVSVSGGGDAVRFNMNIGFVDQTGNTLNTAYNKYSSSFKLDYILSDKLRFSGNIYFTHHLWNRSKGFGSYSDPLAIAYRRPSFLPAFSPENPDEYSYYYWEDESNIGNVNPIALAKNATNDKVTDNLSANISLNATLAKNLFLRAYVSYKMSNTDYDAFFPYNAVLRSDAEGTPLVSWTDPMVNRFYSGNSYSQKLDQEAVLSYVRKINKHDISIIGVQAINISEGSAYDYEGSNTGSDDLQNTNATNRWLGLGASESERVLIGFRGKLNYQYDDRYGIDVGMNTDAASSFGPDYRWALFPNVGGFWRLSSEKFTDNWTWMDEFKTRFSWGKSGRSPSSAYSHLSTYKRGTNGYNGGAYVIPGNTQLKELHWETTESMDIGIEMSLFKNRVSAELGYYKSQTHDLLTNRSYPSSSGINDKDMKLQRNFGDMENKGWEMNISATPIKTKNLRWTVRANMALQKNKITSWPTEETEWSEAGSESESLSYGKNDDKAFYLRVREGDVLGAFYGYQVDKKMPVYSTPDDVRVYSPDGNVVFDIDGEPMQKYNSYSRKYFEAGDVNYVDQNHDGVINDLDIVQLGDSNPDMFGGIGSTLSYKGWTANIFFNYVVGNDILNFTRFGGELLKHPTNYTTSVMKRWRKPGDITEIPRAVNGKRTSYNNELGGDRYVEDGSFIRLQNVSLTYALPKQFVAKSFLKNASITLSAYNLFVLTNYTGVDPEVSYAGKAFSVGIDRSQTPKQSSYTLSLKVGF